MNTNGLRSEGETIYAFDPNDKRWFARLHVGKGRQFVGSVFGDKIQDSL